MTHEDFTKIFNRFSLIWSSRWEKHFMKNPEGITNEWWDSLKKYKFFDVEGALFKARNAFEWPPTIAEFINLLPKDKIDAPSWTHADSIEIADKILRRVVAKNFSEHCLLTQDILPALEKRIFELRSDKVDFSICQIDNCGEYKIFDESRPLAWMCDKHLEENYAKA